MNLDGVFPPVATPFLSGAGPVDLDALRFNVRRWMATGLRGLVVLGSNGEAALLDEDEADAVIGAAREYVPADRVLIETDSPYLAPVPHRGRRNEPAWVRLVAARVAAETGTSPEVVAARTTANFEALFRP